MPREEQVWPTPGTERSSEMLKGTAQKQDSQGLVPEMWAAAHLC